MNACIRAITSSMHSLKPPANGFKRQVVFRLDAEDWPLLEQAAAEQGSIQAAVLAGLRALETQETSAENGDAPRGDDPPKEQPPRATGPLALEGEEIPAREAAQILKIKPSTVSGYIRAGRLSGRYDETPGASGWLTTRDAVTAYKRRIRRH